MVPVNKGVWGRSGRAFSRPAHVLYGENYAGKILALNTAKGGVASSWMIWTWLPDARRLQRLF